jgi:hypothetical protein
MGKNWAYPQMAILIGTTMINQWMEWGTLFSDKPKFVREGDTLVLLAAGVKSFYHLLALAFKSEETCEGSQVSKRHNMYILYIYIYYFSRHVVCLLSEDF